MGHHEHGGVSGVCGGVPGVCAGVPGVCGGVPGVYGGCLMFCEGDRCDVRVLGGM